MLYKASLLIVFLISSFQNAIGQCPNESVTKFKTQAEVLAFATTYPDCDQLNELEISGTVTDLKPLANLRKLDYLYFEKAKTLGSLEGLGNIDSIFGSVGFYDTLGFNNLCGLNNLKFIGNDLDFEETSNLESLVGLEALEVVGDDVTIDENADLKTLNGIQNISTLGDPTGFTTIQITDNPLLSDCCGIQGIINANFHTSLGISNNAMNCQDSTEIANLDCDFDYTDCLTSSTDNLILNSLEIYPNPTMDIIYLNAQPTQKVSLYNLYGQRIKTYTSSSNKIDISEFAAGTYLLILEGKNKSILSTHKIVKL